MQWMDNKLKLNMFPIDKYMIITYYIVRDEMAAARMQFSTWDILTFSRMFTLKLSYACSSTGPKCHSRRFRIVYLAQARKRICDPSTSVLESCAWARTLDRSECKSGKDEIWCFQWGDRRSVNLGDSERNTINELHRAETLTANRSIAITIGLHGGQRMLLQIHSGTQDNVSPSPHSDLRCFQYYALGTAERPAGSLVSYSVQC